MKPSERRPDGCPPAECDAALDRCTGQARLLTVKPRSDVIGAGEPVFAPDDPVRLCICVDDFGLHSSINAAALDLVARGRVHAVACQVGGNTWRVGASQLRRCQDVDIGLHLDLTKKPLRSVAQPLSRLIARSLMRRLDPAELEVEVAAQLDRFESCLGRAPDFVAGHQHVHQLPQVREALLAVLQRRGSRRPWLRTSRRRSPPAGSWSASFKHRTIELLGAAELERQGRDAGFRRNEALLGICDFTPSMLGYADCLQEWLAAAKDGDVLVCHPGRTVRHQSGPTPAAHRAEYQVLSGVALGLFLSEKDITLARMSRTLETRGC